MILSYILELLWDLVWVLEDFTGPLSEKIIRKDLIIIYEVIDEFFDFGYTGITNTDEMSNHIEY